MSRSGKISQITPHGQMTADYGSMILEPHTFVPRKHLDGASAVFAIKSQYGKFSYNALLKLATNGVVPRIKGMAEFSPAWSRAFCDAWAEVPESIRFQLLNVFDKRGHHFAKTLQIAMRDCGVSMA